MGNGRGELHGWAGQVLWIDLSDGGVTKVPTTDYEPEKYLGGVGLNTRIFWSLGAPRVCALDPGNPLLVASGPLSGLPGPFGRGHICGVSPMTYPQELFFYSSFGGRFPAELKYAGYDALAIVGKAKEPVYVSIRGDRVEVRSAQHLWGLDTHETQRAIESSEGKCSTLCMGPAGESLYPGAVVVNETGSTAGQGGFGAVMGSKNLKAIVVKGSGSVRIADPQRFMRLLAGRKQAGDWLEGREDLRSPLGAGRVQAEMVEKYRKKYAGCYACQFNCFAFYDVPGIGKGAAQCAQWWHQRSNNQDARAVWEAQVLPQKLGINVWDLIGISKFLEFATKQGVVSWEQVGLPAPRMWGGEASDHEFLTALIGGIADGTSIFSKGAARAVHLLAQQSSDPQAATRAFEVIFPAFGSTIHYLGWIGFALHWALDVRDPGGGVDEYHEFGFESSWFKDGSRHDVLAGHFGMPGGEATFAHAPGRAVKAVYEGLERQTLWVQMGESVRNSMPMCAFHGLPSFFFHPPEMDFRVFMSEALSAVTGLETDADDLWRIGERIWNLRRAVMVKREGRSRSADTLQDAVFDTVWDEENSGADYFYSGQGEPDREGPSDATAEKGFADGEAFVSSQFDRAQFEALKDRYYALCGWDVETGWPTRASLERLDMVDVADELDKESLLK